MSNTQEFIQLENLADIVMGQSPESTSCNADENGLPFLQGCAEFGRQSPFTEVYCFPPLRVSKPDSILISVRAPVGKLNWGEQSYCIGRGLGTIKAKPNLSDTRFLSYSIEQNVSFLHRRSQGSTFLAVGANDIKIFPIPAFSYAKQEKIARILQTIDQAIEKTEALIEKYQHIKAGLMHDLFTRGIGADGKLRPPREQATELYQQTPVGWIPKEWEPLKLKDILKSSGGYLQTGPFGSQLHSHEYTHEGVPVVMPQDINDGIIDEVHIARILERRAQSLLKHRLKIGDIIIARRGELSRAAAIADIEQGWVCGTGCFLLRLGGSNLDARFFSLVYRHPMVQRQVEGLAVGSTMPSLNNEIMGKLIFPYMSKTEQTAIADKVKLSEARITTLQSELVKLRNQKSGLVHALLTGKVLVKVDESEQEPT
ncbi:MAG: restriction endonuclease subunit S [Methylococcales bacterium]|nr:restriction endonuclease subunit S [Methylococcales bacterium]